MAKVAYVNNKEYVYEVFGAMERVIEKWGSVTELLIYDDGKWIWVDSVGYEPYEESDS